MCKFLMRPRAKPKEEQKRILFFANVYPRIIPPYPIVIYELFELIVE